MTEKRIGYLLLGTLLLASCARAPKTDFKLIRLIDLMKAASVVSSNATPAARCIGIMKELEKNLLKKRSESVTLDSEVREKLKALGYIH